MKKHFKFFMSLSWSDRLAAILFWALVVASALILNGCALAKLVRSESVRDSVMEFQRNAIEMQEWLLTDSMGGAPQ